SRSRADGGSGIGLALCTRIAQAHGTQLQIDSTEGVGTTVTVSVPILSPDDLPAADADGKEQP
ncbi:MAG: ATP-binding protein, partial [Gemmiger sp.]